MAASGHASWYDVLNEYKWVPDSKFTTLSMKDLTDVVCKCSLCKEMYKDPRLLLCLHRYCRDCLEGMIDSKEQEKKISCPECRQTFVLPEEGIEGLKSDFQIKYITEHLRLVTSLLNTHTSECCVCAEQSVVSAYCYKCANYLCNECYEDHSSRLCFQGHELYIFSSKDLKSKNTTFETLASLMKDPHCQMHSQNVAQLCCISCGNIPICLVCIHGEHKKHSTGDVIGLAKRKTEKLIAELAPLQECKEKLDRMKVTVKKVEMELQKSFTESRKESQTKYQEELQKIKTRLKGVQEAIDMRKMEVDNGYNENTQTMQRNMEAEIQEVRKRYKGKFDNERTHYKCMLAELSSTLKKEETRLQDRHKVLDESYSELKKSKESQCLRAFSEISNILQHVNDTSERLKNLTTTATRVISSNHDWTVMKCVPVICAAVSPLVQDATKEFPQMKDLPQIAHTDPSLLTILSRRYTTKISEVEERVITLQGIREQGFHIRDMTTFGKGNIIVSGEARQRQSYVAYVDLSGKIQQQVNFDSNIRNPMRFCASLSDHSAATVGEPGEIGIVDFQDFANLKKFISDLIPGWSEHNVANCVTVDSVRCRIFVGCKDSRDIHVFNIRLERAQPVTLPDLIGWPHCITFTDDVLLVCDFDGKIACAVSMEGEILHKFQPPADYERCDRPCSVCTDQNGLIYLLWVNTGVSVGRHTSVVVQYSQERGHVRMTRIVDGSARCVTTIREDESEKLLVATWKTAKVFVYNLMFDEES